MVLCYEDLVTHPKEVLQRILEEGMRRLDLVLGIPRHTAFTDPLPAGGVDGGGS